MKIFIIIAGIIITILAWSSGYATGKSYIRERNPILRQQTSDFPMELIDQCKYYEDGSMYCSSKN